MTRYARAKGSKSCNSKTACSATPWHLLKEQAASVKCGSDQVTKTVKSREEGKAAIANSTTGWFNFSAVSECKSNGPEEAFKKSNSLRKKSKQKKLLNKSLKILNPKISSGEVDVNFKPVFTNEKDTSCQISDKKTEVRKEYSSKSSKPSTPKNKIQNSSTLSGKFTVTKNSSYSKDSIRNESFTETYDLRESRRKEKATKREKKKVCFCCRRWGHQLSECPEARTDNKMDVIATPGSFCYNCGSTEHNMTKCSKPGRKTFKFARCFVCNEEGHLARLCPENPMGNYPKGGSCLLCGEVSHLRVDCPKANRGNGETETTLTCVTSGPIESLPEDLVNSVASVKSERRVKF